MDKLLQQIQINKLKINKLKAKGSFWSFLFFLIVLLYFLSSLFISADSLECITSISNLLNELARVLSSS